MSEAGKKIVIALTVASVVTGVICLFIFTHPDFNPRNNGIQTLECGYGTLVNDSAGKVCVCDRFHALVSLNDSISLYRKCSYQRKSHVFAALLQAFPLFSWFGAGFIYIELYFFAEVCGVLTLLLVAICISTYQNCREPPTDAESVNNVIGVASMGLASIALLVVIFPALLGSGLLRDGNNNDLGP